MCHYAKLNCMSSWVSCVLTSYVLFCHFYIHLQWIQWGIWKRHLGSSISVVLFLSLCVVGLHWLFYRTRSISKGVVIALIEAIIQLELWLPEVLTTSWYNMGQKIKWEVINKIVLVGPINGYHHFNLMRWQRHWELK